MTLYKASKPNERGPKGKKTRRSALRGDAEGNGGVHEEEARMEGGDGRDVSWRLCVCRTSSYRRPRIRIHGEASRKLTEDSHAKFDRTQQME